ncbi:BMP family protein [Naumannella halotolerans]|uniref:Simple sugar transport system substrate-binding protein n=1 Tax=Naumannella halotolerans TaxID=993414 RepID=A0A4R7J8G8_9ACTN|nr:BMP family protein [Naumannella halotolerans]TDT33574.1 simple sugar transport system substrate-binding protein [Naumannella halotolerans]
MAIIYYPQFLDGSWGEAALTGGEQLLEEGAISDLATQENIEPGSGAVDALRDYADQGYDIVVAHSFNYGDDVKQVASEYPETLFVYAGGFGDVAGNVGDYSQPFYEPSYLMGILAAGYQPEGNVGGASGFDIPVCRGMYNAYLDGAQEVRPEVTGSYVAVGDWEDVQLATETANAQADAGATMFVGCGQGPTFGQIEAANQRDLTAVGYTGDMSGRSDRVVASFTWNLAEVFRLMVADVEGGFDGQAGYYEAKYADGAMTVVVNPAAESAITDEAMQLFTEQEAAMRDGSLILEENTE